MQLEAQLHEDSSSEELLAQVPRSTRWAPWRIAAVTATLLAATAVLALGVGSTSTKMTSMAARPEITQLDEIADDPCNLMPFLRIMSIKSNNLGGKGPQKDKEEGIMYAAEAHNIGSNATDTMEVHVHAVSENYFSHGAEEGTNVSDAAYDPEWPKVNGVKGHFGAINIHPGTNVTVQLHGYDATLGKDIHVPRFALTFFDLDAGKDGNMSVEFLKINNFAKYFVTNETELEIREEEDGAYKFTATKEGTGADNPKNPLELTVLQKNRAVSFVFEDQKEVIFEVGASPGATARVFLFVMRPILRCAYTKLGDGTLIAANDTQSPISLVQGGGSEHTRCSLVLVLGLALMSVQRWL